jgi:hypothetical protein
MNSLSMTFPNGTSKSLYTPAAGTKGTPVFLDSGATLSFLPTAMFNALLAVFPTATPIGQGFYKVDCRLAGSPGSVDFGFGGVVIRVALKDVIWHAPENDPPLCVLGILADTGEFNLCLVQYLCDEPQVLLLDRVE